MRVRTRSQRLLGVLRGRRVAALVAASALASSMAFVAAGPTHAATRFGNDVSWPQCSKAQGGYGLPMPPDSASFVVIGLTKGLPFTVNPCLKQQVAWAKSRSVPAQAYTIPAFPTPSQLFTYSSQGPWSGTTRWGQLANAGYAQGTYSLNQLSAAGFTPRMVWVDVETRTAQPWPTGTRLREAENRALITGMLRRLDDAGLSYGIYTNTSGWQTITGTWWLPGVPAWVTVGRRTQADAVAACGRPGISGGPPHLAQWFDDTRDYDLTCPAYQPAPPRPYPPSDAGDLDGNWTADLLARDGATGVLWLYPRGAGSTQRRQIGTRWHVMDLIDTPGDLTGDGVPDVIARQRETGNLLLYPRSRSGSWLPTRPIGPGWEVMDAVLGVGDFNGDRIPDVLARERETGDLLLYRGTGTGSLAAGLQVGHGWGVFDRLFGPGDVDGDGSVDVLARRPSDGGLWLYRGNGRGGWSGSAQIGTGWNAFDLIATPGDLTMDAAPDVVARDPKTGALWVYPTDGTGRWRPRAQLGPGWNGMDLIS